MEEEGLSPSSSRSFAAPSTASSLDPYVNREQEKIFEAFHAGSYRRIQTIGGESLEQGTKAFRTGGPSKSYPSYEYVPSSYDLVDSIIREQRAEHMMKMKGAGHEKEFIVPSLESVRRETQRQYYEASRKRDQTTTAPASTFGLIPLMPFPDPFDSVEEQVRLEKKEQFLKMVGGPFLPPGSPHAGLSAHPQQSEEWTKSREKELCKLIRKQLKQDWNTQGTLTVPEIEVDDEGYFVVSFHLWSGDSFAAASNAQKPGEDVVVPSTPANGATRAVMAYMNVFYRTSPLILESRLVRVAEKWGLFSDGGSAMIFTLRPPWVRGKLRETFSSLQFAK
eukprot:TRINITY_DN23740_c0_g1_i1.p1 TRINITY_DN23740_c0_g1~~TRINITY_DN23740_c0_g1_i1.p1  ORF type:complete len:335 (-),score=91.72 TRINITY_DN23740_c0_g1_i1:1114-2118(-)